MTVALLTNSSTMHATDVVIRSYMLIEGCFVLHPRIFKCALHSQVVTWHGYSHAAQPVSLTNDS